jgi:peptidoglycan/xylan/chitin deacetylase (PgdA/CDA1 family)
MKSTASVVLCCALIAFSSLLSGCEKVKSLLAKKSARPKPTAEAAPNAPTPPPTAASGGVKNTNAPQPPQPVAATAANPTVGINKSAAVMVLCYHRFEEKPRPKDALAITPAQFEKEMQAVKDAGFSVIPMQDFLAWRRSEKDIPAKSCVVTIDDGYLSGYEMAWPILKKFNYPFTMFVYVNYIGSGGKSISWDQLAEMRDAGVDIQSHTYSHSNLRVPGGGVDKHTRDLVMKDVQALGADGWLRKEILGSKQELEKQLGIRVNAIAYPFGIYSQKARDMVKEAGYEAAFTVYGQRLGFSTPSFDQLGRYAIDQNNAQIFQSALNMIGGGSSGGPVASAPAVAQIAAASMITQPMEGETIGNPKPIVKANLATMGDIEPGSVEMRISGLGAVPAKYDPATKTVSYQVTQPLQAHNYTVLLNAKVGGKRVETRWTFIFDPLKK